MRTAGQKCYEQHCKEFGISPRWATISASMKEKWERIAKAPQTADDIPPEPPTSGN